MGICIVIIMFTVIVMFIVYHCLCYHIVMFSYCYLVICVSSYSYIFLPVSDLPARPLHDAAEVEA